MTNKNPKRLVFASLTVASALMLAACDSDDDDNNSNNNINNTELSSDNIQSPIGDNTQPPSFDISVTNLTAAQPFSPLTVVAFNNDFKAFTIGEPATPGLEILAEGGDNASLISEAEEAGAYAIMSGAAPVGPKSSDTLSITLSEEQLDNAQLSLLTMLVNTNDAFTGISNVSLADLEVGESMTINTLSYDSGTEANSEAQGTIPGPADGGEGYNSERDDLKDHVTLHSGAITMDDGLASSVLTEAHRWDNPTARVTITRRQ